MADDFTYPKIKCFGPTLMSRDELIAQLRAQDCACLNCNETFQDGDVCAWAGTPFYVEHAHCKHPQDPSEAHRQAAMQAVRTMDEGLR